MGDDLTAGTYAGPVAYVALSGDGSHVAVGAPTAGNGTVAVFRYSRDSSTWDAVGEPPLAGTGADNAFGSTVSLSRDGSRLAVGAESEDGGYVRIFDWNSKDVHWHMAPAVNLTGTTGERFGRNVRLSGNGAIFAAAKIEMGGSGKVITHALECDAEAAGAPPNGRMGNCSAVARLLNVSGAKTTCMPECDDGFNLTEASKCDPFTGGFKSGRCLCPCDAAWHDLGFYM
jgi:hypothetical protein